MSVDSLRVRSCLAVAQEHLDDPLVLQKVEQLMVAVMLAHSDDVKTFEDELAWLDAKDDDDEEADEWDDWEVEDDDEDDSDEP